MVSNKNEKGLLSITHKDIGTWWLLIILQIWIAFMGIFSLYAFLYICVNYEIIFYVKRGTEQITGLLAVILLFLPITLGIVLSERIWAVGKKNWKQYVTIGIEIVLQLLVTLFYTSFVPFLSFISEKNELRSGALSILRRVPEITQIRIPLETKLQWLSLCKEHLASQDLGIANKFWEKIEKGIDWATIDTIENLIMAIINQVIQLMEKTPVELFDTIWHHSVLSTILLSVEGALIFPIIMHLICDIVEEHLIYRHLPELVEELTEIYSLIIDFHQLSQINDSDSIIFRIQGQMLYMIENMGYMKELMIWILSWIKLFI